MERLAHINRLILILVLVPAGVVGVVPPPQEAPVASEPTSNGADPTEAGPTEPGVADGGDKDVTVMPLRRPKTPTLPVDDVALEAEGDGVAEGLAALGGVASHRVEPVYGRVRVHLQVGGDEELRPAIFELARSRALPRSFFGRHLALGRLLRPLGETHGHRLGAPVAHILEARRAAGLTLGNVAGGAVLVAGAYWVLYRRPRRSAAARGG